MLQYCIIFVSAKHAKKGFGLGLLYQQHPKNTTMHCITSALLCLIPLCHLRGNAKTKGKLGLIPGELGNKALFRVYVYAF